ncbi:MAG: hypothetical protein HC811_05685 [Flammeovirgaceae bacterium]|nr:hypothetical protein [Flammeovirgaceae bacterium]
MKISKWAHWLPRISAIVLALFLSLFSLDAFNENQSIIASIVDWLIHVTPVWFILIVLIASWKRPIIGTVMFTLAGLYYSIAAWGNWNWIASIAGPLIIVAILYYISYRKNSTS